MLDDHRTESTWGHELRTAIASTRAAIEALASIHDYVSANIAPHDALPRELPASIAELFNKAQRELAAADVAVSRAFRRYSSEPVELLFTNQPLSREQYFRLRAMGSARSELPTPDWLAAEESSS